jgi:hypothetical protein
LDLFQKTNEIVTTFLSLVVVDGLFEYPSYFFVCVLGCVFCLGCFWGFVLGSWAWEKLFCMLLGSAWAMLGIPSYVGREQ